jgi:adenylate cyclase
MGYTFSFIYPLGLLAAQYIAILAEKFIAEQLEKKRVTDVFGKYVAPQIVDEILKEGETGLKLGGTRRDITVLFVDIRGFTPLSESAEPEEVVSILNQYLSLCAEAIFAYGGTLDKYIGDATMALFNAPLDLEDHQLRAVQTALAMQEGAKPLQEKLEKEFGKVVRFGVGIHTGPAIVGNIGADFRMDYTAIGDTVNTSARLESNSKPGQILISSEVYGYVKEHVEVTDLGLIQVKGKAQGVQVYQVDKLIAAEGGV